MNRHVTELAFEQEDVIQSFLHEEFPNLKMKHEICPFKVDQKFHISMVVS